MDTIKRFGNVVTDFETFMRLPTRAKGIKSWDNEAFATKTGQEIKEMVLKGREKNGKGGLYVESVFDAARGRGYLMMVVPYRVDGVSESGQMEAIRAGRKACFDYLGEG